MLNKLLESFRIVEVEKIVLSLKKSISSIEFILTFW